MSRAKHTHPRRKGGWPKWAKKGGQCSGGIALFSDLTAPEHPRAHTIFISSLPLLVKLSCLPDGMLIRYNRAMRKMVLRKKIVIGAVVLLFVFGLNLVSGQVRGFVMSVSSPFLTVLWNAGDNVSMFFAGGSLRKENELLEQKNFALLQELIQFEDTAKENDELRRILEFDAQEDFDLVMGEIIGKNIAEDIITVRVGRNKGIREGMPVITASRVAVGKVIRVFEDSSSVQLLSAVDKKIDAKISETAVTGVIRGEGGQHMILDLVPQEDEISMGDIVVTSSLGNVFPENILIGEVQEILKTGSDPFQKARLLPFFKIKTTEFVLIIVS